MSTAWNFDAPRLVAVYPTFLVLKWEEPKAAPIPNSSGTSVVGPPDLRWSYNIHWRENTEPSILPQTQEATPLQHIVIPRNSFRNPKGARVTSQQPPSVGLELTVQVTCVGTPKTVVATPPPTASEGSSVSLNNQPSQITTLVWHRVINFARDDDAQLMQFRFWRTSKGPSPGRSVALGKLPVLNAYVLSTVGHVDRLPLGIAALMDAQRVVGGKDRCGGRPLRTHPCVMGQGLVGGTPVVVVRVQYQGAMDVDSQGCNGVRALEDFTTFFYLVCLDGLGDSAPACTSFLNSQPALSQHKKSSSDSVVSPAHRSPTSGAAPSEFASVKRFVVGSPLASTVKQLIINQSTRFATLRSQAQPDSEHFYSYPASTVQETSAVFSLRSLVALLERNTSAAVVFCGFRHVCGHMANIAAAGMLSTIEGNHPPEEVKDLCGRIFAVNFDGPHPELLTPVLRTDTIQATTPGQAPKTKLVRSYILQSTAAAYGGQFLSIPLSLLREDDVLASYGSHGDYGTQLAVQHNQRAILQVTTSTHVTSTSTIAASIASNAAQSGSSSQSGSTGGSGGSSSGPKGAVPQELLPSLEGFTDVHLIGDATQDLTRSYSVSSRDLSLSFAASNAVTLFGTKAVASPEIGDRRLLLMEEDRVSPATHCDEACRLPTASAVASALNALVTAATVSSSVLGGKQAKNTTIPSSVAAAYSEGLMQYYHAELSRMQSVDNTITAPPGSTSPRREASPSTAAPRPPLVVPGPHLVGPAVSSCISTGLSMLAPSGSLRHPSASWSTLSNLSFGVAGTTVLGTAYATDAQVGNPLLNLPFSGSTATILGQVFPYFQPTTQRSGSGYAALGFCNPHVVAPRGRMLPPSVSLDLASATPTALNATSAAYIYNPSIPTKVGYGYAGGIAPDCISTASHCATAFCFGRTTSAALGFRVELEMGRNDAVSSRINAPFFGEAQPLALPTMGRSGLPVVEAFAFGLPSTIAGEGLAVTAAPNFNLHFLPAFASFCTKAPVGQLEERLLKPVINNATARLASTTLPDGKEFAPSFSTSGASVAGGTLLEVTLQGKGLIGCDCTIQCTAPMQAPPQTIRLLPRFVSAAVPHPTGHAEEVVVGYARLEDHLVAMPTLSALQLSVLVSSLYGATACDTFVSVPEEISLPMTEWCGAATQGRGEPSSLTGRGLSVSPRAWVVGPTKVVLQNAVLIDPSFWSLFEGGGGSRDPKRMGAVPTPVSLQPTPGLTGRLLLSLEIAADILNDLQARRSSLFSKLSNAASKLTGRRQLPLPAVIGDFCPFNWEVYLLGAAGSGAQSPRSQSMFNAVPSGIPNTYFRTLSEHIRARKDIKALNQQTQLWRTKIEGIFGVWMEPVTYAARLRSLYSVLVTQYFYTRAFLATRGIQRLPSATGPSTLRGGMSTPQTPGGSSSNDDSEWIEVSPSALLGVGIGPQSSASMGGYVPAGYSVFDSAPLLVSPGSVAILAAAGEPTHHLPRSLALRDPARWTQRFPAPLMEALVNAYLVGVMQMAGLVASLADVKGPQPQTMSTTTITPPSSAPGSMPPAYLRHLRNAHVGEARSFLETLQQGSGLSIPQTGSKGLPVPVPLALSFGAFYTLLFPLVKDSPICADMTSEEVLADVVIPLWCIPTFVHLRKSALHTQIVNFLGAPRTGISTCRSLVSGFADPSQSRVVKETFRLDEAVTAAQKGVKSVIVCVCEMFDVGTESFTRQFVVPLELGLGTCGGNTTLLFVINKADEFLRKSVAAAGNAVDSSRSAPLPVDDIVNVDVTAICDAVTVFIMEGSQSPNAMFRGVRDAQWAAALAAPTASTVAASPWEDLIQSMICSALVFNLCQGMAGRLNSDPAIAALRRAHRKGSDISTATSSGGLRVWVEGIAANPREAYLEDAVAGLHDHLEKLASSVAANLASRSTIIPAGHPVLSLVAASLIVTAPSLGNALLAYTHSVTEAAIAQNNNAE